MTKKQMETATFSQVKKYLKDNEYNCNGDVQFGNSISFVFKKNPKPIEFTKKKLYIASEYRQICYVETGNLQTRKVLTEKN
jgi:hypothetical protein